MPTKTTFIAASKMNNDRESFLKIISPRYPQDFHPLQKFSLHPELVGTLKTPIH